MKRAGGMKILALSIALGLVATLLAVSFLKTAAKTMQVVVAVQEIQPFNPLTQGQFALQQMPATAVPPDAVTDLSSVNGHYSRALVLKGTVLRQGHLASDTGTTGSLAAKLTSSNQPGHRALAIPVDDATGVAGTLQAGDKVDIIAAVSLEQEILAKVIAQQVPVLYRTVPEDGQTKATVVVEVDLVQAEEIAFAETAGTIYLATNPYRPNNKSETTTGVTQSLFLQKYGTTAAKSGR